MARVKFTYFKLLYSLFILVGSTYVMAVDVLHQSESTTALPQPELPGNVLERGPVKSLSQPGQLDDESGLEPIGDIPGNDEDENSLSERINGAGVSAMENLGEGQARLSTNFLAAVARMDRIFGDERLFEDANTSTMTLGVGVEVSRFDGLSFKHKTRARISLPRMKDRIMLEFNQETEADDVETRSQIRSAYKDTTPDLGLRLNLLPPETIHLTASAGLRLGSPSQGYGRIRASRLFPLNPLTSIYIAQELKYYSVDRWSEKSTVRLNHCVFDTWVIESLLSLRWQESESGYEPYLMFSFMHEHKEKRAIRFDVGAAWPETPHTRDSRYFLQGTRRRRLGRKWLFGEIRLGVAFPEKENFAADPFVRVMVEMVLQE